MKELLSNCCGAGDDMDGNLDNNEGICSDCKEPCEMVNSTEDIERILRFNCPNGCDGNGSYPEMSSDGDWEQGQCQWCFEYGMPAREAIQQEANRQKLALLERLEEQAVTPPGYVEVKVIPLSAVQKEKEKLV